MILIDTSVLSHVFRRPPRADNAVVAQFTRIVAEQTDVGIPGIVYQELLSGVRDDGQVDRLRSALDGFPIVLAQHEDHLEAARMVNVLRRKGHAVSTVDALIAATCVRRHGVLFTLDRDFAIFTRLASLQIIGLTK